MELYYLITISDRDRAEMLSAIYHAAGTGMVLTQCVKMQPLFAVYSFPHAVIFPAVPPYFIFQICPQFIIKSFCR